MLIQYFTINNTYKLAYFHQKIDDTKPTIVFLHGYASTLDGTKSLFLLDLCKKLQLNYLCFELRGHGKSDGNLYDLSIADFLHDAETIINNLCASSEIILVGSSLGGWLSFLYALKFPKKALALISIAPALDFTEDIMNTMNISLLNEDLIPIESIFISKKLLTTAQKYLLLHSHINIDIPVRILHGMQDSAVPYQKSLRIIALLNATDVELHLFKDGDHRLSEPKYLEHLKKYILEFIPNNA